MVNPHCAGITGGNGPSHSIPPQLPRSSSHTAPPYSYPHTSPTEFPPHSPGEMLNQMVQERNRVQFGGVRSVHNVTALMNTLCLPMAQRWELSHSLDYCHLTACSDTQCNICTQRLQLHVCVGCNVRLTVNKQTNKQTHHTHLWQLSSLPPNQTRGLLQRYTENAQEMQALSGPHT